MYFKGSPPLLALRRDSLRLPGGLPSRSLPNGRRLVDERGFEPPTFPVKTGTDAAVAMLRQSQNLNGRRDSSTTQPDAPQNGAEEKIGLLRSE